MFVSLCRRSASGQRGAAAVEFALVLPLLLLVIGGVVDFGRMYFTEVTLTNAAREGARAAVVGLSAPDVQTRTRAAVPEPLKSAMSVPPVACAPSQDEVTVTVSTDFEWFVLGPIMNLFPGGSGALPSTLSSEATMRCGG